MKRIISAAPILLLLISVALFALAWRSRDRPPRFGENVRIDSVARSMGTLPSGGHFPATFTFANRSSRPVTIVGSTNICMASACLNANDLPVKVEPGGSRAVVVDVHTVAPGDFSGQIVLFSDCEGGGKIPLAVSCRVVPNPKPSVGLSSLIRN